MTTPYHIQHWAHALTLKSASDSIQTLSRSIPNARVDLNPHQVGAALFAFRSPLAKGIILAEEVTLGKTIEPGLVIARRWEERRKKLLLILPSTHLDFRADERGRLALAKVINEPAPQHMERPALLASDLNATPDSETIQHFETLWTHANKKTMATAPRASADEAA